MPHLNKVLVMGHLGRDPEVRYMTNGKAACNFPVAASEQWKDKQTGEKQEHTEWFCIAAFGRLAEICGEYLKKGSAVYIEGKSRTRKWQDKDGNDRWSTEIIAEQMQMLGGRGTSNNSGSQSEPSSEPTNEVDFDDDLPF